MSCVLTEWAFFEDPDETWKALYPSITSPHGGIKKVRGISTPNGKGNRFAETILGAQRRRESGERRQIHVPEDVAERIAKVERELVDQGRGAGLRAADAQLDWSVHILTIYDAVRRGLDVNITELFAGMDSIEGWRQEFECEFMDSAAVLFPYDLISRCEGVEAVTTQPDEYWSPAKGGAPVDLGIDFGRKRDLTVCWALEAGGRALTRDVLTLENVPTPEQARRLASRVSRCRRACLDYTGPGIGLGDLLVEQFGEWKPAENKFGKIELVTFGNTIKVELFTKLRMAFESASLLIPVDRAIREDLHSLYRITTPTGHVSYRAPHTDDGHADRATALALAWRAHQQEHHHFSYERVTTGGPGSIQRGRGMAV